jgi:hypothetical protein
MSQEGSKSVGRKGMVRPRWCETGRITEMMQSSVYEVD